MYYLWDIFKEQWRTIELKEWKSDLIYKKGAGEKKNQETTEEYLDPKNTKGISLQNIAKITKCNNYQKSSWIC